MHLCVLTVNPEFSLGGGDAAAVLSRAAVDAHVSGQHGGDDELVAALLVLVDHVVVILLQHFAVLEPAHGRRRLADDDAVEAHRVAVRNVLIFQLCQEYWCGWVVKGHGRKGLEPDMLKGWITKDTSGVQRVLKCINYTQEKNNNKKNKSNTIIKVAF